MVRFGVDTPVGNRDLLVLVFLTVDTYNETRVAITSANLQPYLYLR